MASGEQLTPARLPPAVAALARAGFRWTGAKELAREWRIGLLDAMRRVDQWRATHGY
jgi:hypothetical protein